MVKYEPAPLSDYWEPKVSCIDGPAYSIALDANEGTVTSGTTTEMIYQKYDTGWSLNSTGPWSDSVTVVRPTRSGYDFAGYYTDPRDGYGEMIINSNGQTIVGPTYFTEYNSAGGADATLYAHWTQGVNWVFNATTANLAANATVEFKISAAGKFYVDCDNGAALLTINRSSTSATTYSCSYSSGGVHTIKFGLKQNEGATSYNANSNVPAIEFVSDNITAISGSLGQLFRTIGNNQPSFYQTFKNNTALVGTIPSNLFSGITGTAKAYMFYETFYNTG
jgi:hypothetical protein